jgi:hypothetical protein
METTNSIFDQLWSIYTDQNPQTQKVFDLFNKRGELLVNDHIAFRTFDDERINIDVLSKVFINAGYVFKDDYHFEEKKLYAKHFEHGSNNNAPRVFISQLKTKEFSNYLQSTIKSCIDKIPEEILNSDELIYSGTVWGEVSFAVYEALRKESEYAAWLYVNGFRANHFTVNVNELKTFENLEQVNDFLKENGFLLNDSGGEIKGTPQELLEQSSITAELYQQTFVDGEHFIPGCYYEFARRYPDANGELYSGFIAKSADKIFESTDLRK